MAKNSNGLGLALIFSITTALAGCSGNSDELDEKLTHSASITLVNSWSSMADLHVAKRSFDSGYSGLFDTDNLVSPDVPVNEVGEPYLYSYKAINNIVNLGIRDSINKNNEQRITKTLTNGEKLWVIAWEESSSKKLSVVTRAQHNKSDAFNVRLFADGNYAVFVDSNNVLNAEKGKVTPYLEINNCANSLKVADIAIDLCAAELGASYLLIVDRNGSNVIVAE